LDVTRSHQEGQTSYQYELHSHTTPILGKCSVVNCTCMHIFCGVLFPDEESLLSHWFLCNCDYCSVLSYGWAFTSPIWRHFTSI